MLSCIYVDVSGIKSKRGYLLEIISQSSEFIELNGQDFLFV